MVSLVLWENGKNMKVKVTVVLDIDAETEDECAEIIQEMDYEFKHIDEDFDIDLIVSHEIRNWEFIDTTNNRQ